MMCQTQDTQDAWPEEEISMLVFSHKPSGAPGNRRKKVWV